MAVELYKTVVPVDVAVVVFVELVAKRVDFDSSWDSAGEDVELSKTDLRSSFHLEGPN